VFRRRFFAAGGMKNRLVAIHKNRRLNLFKALILLFARCFGLLSTDKRDKLDLTDRKKRKIVYLRE
jgi:hypothetical protein